MTFMTVIVRTIVGAIIGWLIGITLTRVMFRIENYRIERMMMKQRTDDAIKAAYAPILEMDRRQW